MRSIEGKLGSMRVDLGGWENNRLVKTSKKAEIVEGDW